MNYQLQKDEVLIDLLEKSDAKAFDEIYRRYWQPVFRYAVCKVHVQQVAEDLVQDVFVSLWQRRAEVAIRNAEAYLIQSVKFAVLNYFRLQVQDKKHQNVVSMYKRNDAQTEDTVSLHNLLSAWQKAVASLPAKTAEIFRLSKEADYSNKEIAGKLRLSEKAVEYHITKSHKIVRLQLRDFLTLLVVFLLHR